MGHSDQREEPRQPDPKARFSSRVEPYARHRPRYPREVLIHLTGRIGLTPDWVVADIGSGTGISSELFLSHGNAVFGVEPNPDMRAAAERLLAGRPGFRSIDGAAEATTLADGSVDLVAAGQAFHWFDPQAARAEFGRILRPGGWVVLFWNDRHTVGSPFLEAYERLLLEHGTDYQRVRHTNIDDAAFRRFFGPGGFDAAAFANSHAFDYPGLEGRLVSSSYVPVPGQSGYDKMLLDLRRAFDSFQIEGRVTMEYDTRVFTGRLT